jgi:hypothetical protein
MLRWAPGPHAKASWEKMGIKGKEKSIKSKILNIILILQKQTVQEEFSRK